MSKTPVFISGIGRSGTSAVIKSITEHHEVVKPDRVGEAPFIGHFVNFLHDYEDVSKDREYNLKNYQLDERQRAEEFARLLGMLQYGKDISSSEIEGKHWIAKVSLSEQLFKKSREVLGDVKVIYVMRNGVEVVNSAKSFHGFAHLTFEQLCTRWVDNIRQCHYVHNDSNCAVVRHNELVIDPHTVYNDVFEKLGMQKNDAPANFIATNLFNSSFDSTSESVSTANVFNERLKCWDDWSEDEQNTFISICDEKMIEYEFERPYENGSVKASSDSAESDSVLSEIKDTVITSIPTISNQNTLETTEELSEEKKLELHDFYAAINESMRLPQFDYYANASKKQGYLFMENPKVASTTLLKKLHNAELEHGQLPPDNPHDRDLSPITRLTKHSEIDQWNAIFSSDIFRFTFVRNPYSRLLSAYLSKIDKSLRAKAEILAVIQGVNASEVTDLSPDISFAEFVDVVCEQNILDMNAHWKPQVHQVLHNFFNFNFVGHFENLVQDYNYISEELFGVSESELSQSKNKTGSSTKIDSYYDESIRNKVFQCFEMDFEAFGYSQDISKVLEVGSRDASQLRLVG